jgi:HNH endonuclease/AP2 domain
MTKPRTLRDIDLALLRRDYSYNPETGEFSRLFSVKSHAIIGEATRLLHGYRVVDINHRKYFIHRVIWLYVHGKWPNGQIDHIDGDTLNNRLANLRDVSQSQNQWNAGPRKTNTTGFKGVMRAKGGKKFTARIKAHGKAYWLGVFDTAEEASQAYHQRATELHGQFARTK